MSPELAGTPSGDRLAYAQAEMLAPPQLHIVRVDIAPEHEEAFNQWYEAVHIPALLACPGWLSARRFVSLEGGQKYAAVYEVAGEWVYHTPEFLAVKGFMEFEPHVSGFMRQRLAPIGGLGPA